MLKFSSTPTEKYFFTVFILSCALLAVFTGAIYRQSQLSHERDQFVIESYEILRQARLTLIYALNLETGQRGYLLSDEKTFLAPYTASITQLDEQIDKLEDLMETTPVQKDNLLLLRRSVKKFEDLAAAQIKAFEKSRKKGLSTAELERSKAHMEEVRYYINEIITTEQNVLEERTLISKTQQRNYLITLFTGAILALGGLFVANIVIYSLLARNKDAQKEIFETEERYKTVMNGINDGMYDLNLIDGSIYYSPSCKTMLGYKENEYPNALETSVELIHPDDRSSALEELERYKRKEVNFYYNEFRMRHKDGSWRWILSRGIGLWDAEKTTLIRLVGAHTDITTQKDREEELKQLNADLEGFTYIASHDLRAPLVNIKGFSGEIAYSLTKIQDILNRIKPTLSDDEKTLVQESLQQDIPESLKFIEKAVEKMDKLTTAILDLSRIGRREYNLEVVDANTIVKRCLDVLSYEIGQKNVTITCDDLPKVYGDSLALEQVFGNIIDNAIKYLDPSRAGQIKISYKKLPLHILFSIEDNGRGIALADNSKVFDIFRRANNSSNVRGVGMGMAYVKAMLRKLDGKIWFESSLNNGTIFYFTIPFDEKKMAS